MATPRKRREDTLRQVRVYTDVEKAHALSVLASCNGNLAQASRETGVPVRTLASWREKPMAGSVRAAVPIRDALMAQTMERIIWRLFRTVRGKLSEAKLPGVVNAIATLFDRLRILRAQPTLAEGPAAPPLDYSKLTADEIRTLLALVDKAGGDAGQLADATARDTQIVVATSPGDGGPDSFPLPALADVPADSDASFPAAGVPLETEGEQ